MVLWLRFLTEINSNTKEESGDVDYECHHIIKGLYATCSSWHIDPYPRFTQIFTLEHKICGFLTFSATFPRNLLRV